MHTMPFFKVLSKFATYSKLYTAYQFISLLKKILIQNINHEQKINSADYSYLPNIRGSPNKQGGWQNLVMGSVKKISLQYKKVFRG